MTTCNRCRGDGFLNLEQIPSADLDAMDGDLEKIRAWMKSQTDPHDVKVCDCCGDGDDWYGTPGQHYGRDDPPGRIVPYDYNGGLCECH